MSLEELIEAQRVAQQEFYDCEYDTGGALMDTLGAAEDEILRFVLDHANELISWERQYAARMSAVDDYEIGT